MLDRLLEQEGLAIDCLSGASAGAINGALLASGLAHGGRAEARARLARFWHRMTDEAAFLSFTSLPRLLNTTPGAMFTRVLSPAQMNPFDLNPLRQGLAA